MIGTVEGLLYGKKAGLNLEQLIDTIKTGYTENMHVVLLVQQLGLFWGAEWSETISTQDSMWSTT